MIIIEFSFAWIFCIFMIMGLFGIACGLLYHNTDIVILSLALIFVGDGFCIFGSAYYMGHPINGDKGYDEHWNEVCKEFNYSLFSYDAYHPCIMPTAKDNPYEKQPLHPILWAYNFSMGLAKTIASDIKLKVT
jgi:hypothetical protein